MNTSHRNRYRADIARTLSLGLACALAFGRPALAAGIDVKNPPQGTIADDWMIIYLNGEKCGYAHVVHTRKGDVIHSQNLETFKLSRGGQPIAVTQLFTTHEKVDGTPLEFTLDMDMAVQKAHQQGVIRDGKVTVTSGQYEQMITDTFDYPAGALMPWALFRVQEEKGYAPGTEYETGAYIPALASNQAVNIKIKIEQPEEIEHQGRRLKAIRASQRIQMPGMGGLDSVVWLDPKDHMPAKVAMDMMGVKMEMVAASMEEARRDFEAPEAFMNTLVATDKPIDRKTARRLKMKLSLKGDGPEMPTPPKTGIQTPLAIDSRTLLLEVTRQDHAALAKASSPTRPDKGPAAEFLQPNVYINCDDPAVRKMAEEAAGDAKTPYEIADRLRVYVSEKIEDKNLNVGFASASEVCRNKSGDCSEHAVLLAALGRARGLPTQTACGLVYVPHFVGTDHVFGFHMWTQFWIDGQWVDFDAAQNESDCNPTHIALVTDSLKDGGLGELAFAVFPVMARLKIEVLEADPPSAVK